MKFNVKEKQMSAFESICNFQQLARQFFRGDIVHLQHGIVFGDISTYLNKRHERVSLLFSECKREYDYIKTLAPAIPEEIVRLTGLAKYDILLKLRERNKHGKNILFAPSFERDVVSKDGYEPEYRFTDNYAYINAILKSERLAEALKTNGYRLIFKPHYLMRNNLFEFEMSDIVDVLDGDSIYNLYDMSSLMITDYSGIQFEWAYLQKPMLYAHIAENTKFEETYFEYERDGFGDICYTADSLISEIERYITSGCEMPQIYKERVDKFFTFNDGKNCERIYKEIIVLPDTRKVVH